MVKSVGTSSHSGLRDWLIQRVTAVVMAVYCIFFVAVLLLQPSLDYISWKALFAHQWMRLATLIFLLSLFYHAWIGVHDIFIDYVQPAGIRATLGAAAILALAFYALWSINILWGA